MLGPNMFMDKSFEDKVYQNEITDTCEFIPLLQLLEVPL